MNNVYYNVYHLVQKFYEEEAAWEPAIKQEWVEGFLRRRAWEGEEDAVLRRIWNHLKLLEIYLSNTEGEAADLETMTVQELSLAVEWLASRVPDFKATLKNVRAFFADLVEFSRYLADRGVIGEPDRLAEAAEYIAGGRRLKLKRPDLGGLLSLDDYELERLRDDAPPAVVEGLGKMLNRIVEQLMHKLGQYYQREEYAEDFQRALFLYSGPFRPVPDGEDDQFWLGFWDYFLFDYHLLGNDVKPLENFAAATGTALRQEERQLLQRMLNARFTVFYIHRIIDQDWVECVNLFTEERFQLPFPDIDYKSMRRFLFYGHLFSRHMLMINYIASVEASPNLRRRIKEEIARQKAIFEIQHPDAGWDDFFDRHALVVRHSIDMLVSQAKLNVTPAAPAERTFPIIRPKNQPDQEVMARLGKVMRHMGFSYHDVTLARKLWHDFCQLAPVKVRKTNAWTAAVVYAYSQINSPQGLMADDVAGELGTSLNSIYSNRSRIFQTLRLDKYDPRYLSEEGFLFSLFGA